MFYIKPLRKTAVKFFKNTLRCLFLIKLQAQEPTALLKNGHCNSCFSKILTTISRRFILSSRFIQRYSVAIWKVIFNYSFLYLMKSA